MVINLTNQICAKSLVTFEHSPVLCGADHKLNCLLVVVLLHYSECSLNISFNLYLLKLYVVVLVVSYIVFFLH